MEEGKSLKDSYNIQLPQTTFPMRGNLPQTEPLLIDFWQKENIYKKVQNRKAKKSLHFIDGPPYANGSIHLGTALNKVLKDILTKQAWMRGENCPFVPMWDCHGLPIEIRALKKIKNKNPEEIRKASRKEALKWIDVQEKQFQRLGVLADWENKILTMQADYEAEEVRAFSKLANQKLFYRGKRPVHWCIKLRTAAAASEVEYKDHQSPSIDVKLKVHLPSEKEKSFFYDFIKNSNTSISFVIWTTTPWTLPANQAICLHPDIDYGIYENIHTKEFLILALKLKKEFEERTSLKLELKKEFKGRSFEGLLYEHPLFKGKFLPVILGPHVTLDSGTGCVHTAPGHGAEDFAVGQKYNLPVFCPVDEKGAFTEEAPAPYRGKNIFSANSLIIEDLKKSSLLLKEASISHSYPYHPRSKSPLIFLSTNQWFLRFDKKENPIRKQALESLKNIQFTPPWSKERLKAMIQESPDWCLSRQRSWGVPIPVLYCKNCGTPWVNSDFMNALADKMEESSLGIEYYFSTPVEKLIPKKASCSKCFKSDFEKGTDILDVWFDSGVAHWFMQKKQGLFPADVYLEGSDQHRGWFQTSLNSSIALHKKSPFKNLLTHGFVYDIQKRKMSKSLGNIISPEDIIKQHGAEILRLWVASSDFSQDISSGDEILKRVKESYRRFRNTIRFLIGNLYDFDPEKHSVPLSQMREVDQWILSLLNKNSDAILGHYKNFEFHRVYQCLNQFFTTHLSSLYLDIIKDRLYTFKASSSERRSAQSAVYLLLKNLLKLMAPLTSFLSEEAYKFLPGKKKESVFLDIYEDLNFKNNDLDEKFNILLEIKNVLSKKIETLREEKKIGSNLSVQVHLTLPSSVYRIVGSYPYLNEFFIVSNSKVEESTQAKVPDVRAIPITDKEKCPRCWHYTVQPGAESNFCTKCLKNI